MIGIPTIDVQKDAFFHDDLLTFSNWTEIEIESEQHLI